MTALHADQAGSQANETTYASMGTERDYRPVTRSRRVPRGRRIFKTGSEPARAYTVTEGEVVILRRGQLVDLVEPGEVLDPHIWGSVTAVALTDCTLISTPVWS